MTARSRLYRGAVGEEELALVARYQRDDRAAGDILIRMHSGIISTKVRKYLPVARRLGIPFDDLMQEGRMGFARGIAKFKPTYNVRLTTYALYWVSAYVRKYLKQQSSLIRIPSYIQDDIYAGRDDETDPKFVSARAVRSVGSLDAPVFDEGHLAPIDLVEDPSPDPEAHMIQRDREATARALAVRGFQMLSARERDVLRRRCMTEDPETLEMISDGYGLTRQRAQQIETAARARFRASVLSIATPDEKSILPPRDTPPRKVVARAPGRRKPRLIETAVVEAEAAE